MDVQDIFLVAGWLCLIVTAFVGSSMLKLDIIGSFCCPPEIPYTDETGKRRWGTTMKLYIKLLFSYSLVGIAFMISGVPLISFLTRSQGVIAQGVATRLAIIAFLTLGTLASVLVRYLTPYESKRVIDSLYFVLVSGLSLFALFYYPLELSPGLHDIIDPFLQSFRDPEVNFGLIASLLTIAISVIGGELLVLMMRKAPVSVSMLRERQELLGTGEQFLTRGDLMEAVRKIVTEAERDIVWMTNSGDPEIAKSIAKWVDRKNNDKSQYSLRILAPSELYEGDEPRARALRDLRQNIRPLDVGTLRFVIVDRETAIVGTRLSRVEGRGANSGIRIDEPSIVGALLGVFDELWWRPTPQHDEKRPP